MWPTFAGGMVKKGAWTQTVKLLFYQQKTKSNQHSMGQTILIGRGHLSRKLTGTSQTRTSSVAKITAKFAMSTEPRDKKRPLPRTHQIQPVWYTTAPVEHADVSPRPSPFWRKGCGCGVGCDTNKVSLSFFGREMDFLNGMESVLRHGTVMYNELCDSFCISEGNGMEMSI